MSVLTEDAALTRVAPDGGREAGSRPLLHEHRLTLYLDGEPWLSTVCTREYLEQLVLGRLCTSGRIQSLEDLVSLRFTDDETRAEACLRPGPEPVAPRRLTDRSGWGSGEIFRLAAEMKRSMPLHDDTYSTHGCLLLHRGEVLCCREDIGRHNALDKAVGEALLRRLPMEECVLYTTGRVSREIAEKVIAAGIPVLVSRTLPTLEAVEYARGRGLTLIGRAWEEQYEVYAD